VSSDYAESARKRKLHRQAPATSDVPQAPPARKNTKRWCGGKQGREHQPKCFRKNHYGRVSHFYSYCCTQCGKELDSWFDREAAGWGIGWESPRPDWVTDNT
jgi:hypothetical protein